MEIVGATVSGARFGAFAGLALFASACGSPGHSLRYGFFLGAPSLVAEIDPSSAALLWDTQVPVSLQIAGPAHVTVAAALRGEFLYFFVGNTSVAPSANLYAFDLTTRSTTQVMSQIGFNVVGAVARTCSPAAASMR
jgi:hypothetical protein